MAKSVVLGASASLHTRQARQQEQAIDRIVREYSIAADQVLRLMSDADVETLAEGIATEMAGSEAEAVHIAALERFDALDAQLHPDPQHQVEALYLQGVALVGVDGFTKRVKQRGGILD